MHTTLRHKHIVPERLQGLPADVLWLRVRLNGRMIKLDRVGVGKGVAGWLTNNWLR